MPIRERERGRGGGWDATLMKGQQGMRTLVQLAKNCILRWSNLYSVCRRGMRVKFLNGRGRAFIAFFNLYHNGNAPLHHMFAIMRSDRVFFRTLINVSWFMRFGRLLLLYLSFGFMMGCNPHSGSFIC